MNDNSPPAITDQRLLAAMRAVNPQIEKLMADRLGLRQEMRRAREQLEQERLRAQELSHIRDVLVPRYIAMAKAFTVAAAALTLAVLAIAFFTGLLEVKLPASLFASLLLPVWLIDTAERRFGRWELQFGVPIHFSFQPSTR